MRRERDDAVYKCRIAGRAPRDVMQGQAESVMPCVKKRNHRVDRWFLNVFFEAVDVFEGAGDDDEVVFAEDVVAEARTTEESLFLTARAGLSSTIRKPPLPAA